MAAVNEYILGLRDRLIAAPHGQRLEIVDNAARLCGVVPQTLYRKLKECGWTSGRKRRADKGQTCVTADIARLAGGMVETARRANGKKTLPLTTACQLLQDNGLGCKINYVTGEVTMPSPSTVARIAYRHGCHPEQLKKGKPAVSLQSPHPNWCWQMDASVCAIYYLPDGKAQVMDDATFYKNKPANLEKARKDPIIRWVVTDHYSGAFFLRYSKGAEDTAHLLEALVETMIRRSDDDNDCLYGVPSILMADKGSAVRSGPSRALLDALKIKLITHEVGNPRAKGQVEQAQNLVETQFEGRLRMYVVRDLDDLNAAADQWRIAYNLTAEHTRHGKTRHAMWRMIREDQLFIPASKDALLDLAMSKPDEVTVPHNLVLSRTLRGYGQHKYDLRDIPDILPKMKLLLQVNPFRAPSVDLTINYPDGSQRIYTVDPLEITEAGFRADAPVVGLEHKAIADTATDRALKDIQKEAYGAATLKDAQAARDGKQRAYAGIDPMADVKAVPLRQYMPKRGRDLTLSPTLKETAPLCLVDAVFALHDKFSGMGLEWTPEDADRVKEWYGNAVPAADMAGLTDRLLTARMHAGVTLVAGGAA